MILHNTPVQQTRSGRISRPPIIAPNHPLLQTLSGLEIIKASNGDEVMGQEEEGRFWGPDGEMRADDGSQTTKSKSMSGSRVHGRKKRRASTTEEEDEDDTFSAGTDNLQPNGVEKGTNGLPPYPLPPSGPNSRKNMPRDELLARRRARNRVAGRSKHKKGMTLR